MFVQIFIDKGEGGLRWIKTTITIDPLHCTGTPAVSGKGNAGTLIVRTLMEQHWIVVKDNLIYT